MIRSKQQTSGYEFYFNYELNTKTWRQFINKQILQTYHRLVTERQLNEAKKTEKDLKDSIDDMDRKIKAVKLEKQKLKEQRRQAQKLQLQQEMELAEQQQRAASMMGQNSMAPALST